VGGKKSQIGSTKRTERIEKKRGGEIFLTLVKKRKGNIAKWNNKKVLRGRKVKQNLQGKKGEGTGASFLSGS